MSINVAGHTFVFHQRDQQDGLGYDIVWEGKINAPALTHWGRGDKQLGDSPLPIELLNDSGAPPSLNQQQALEWLCSHLQESVKRIQLACEKSWDEVYCCDGEEEMDDDVEYFIERIRIPPNTAPEWGQNQQDPALPSLIVVDLEQDWEWEHGFYVVLGPSNPARDFWSDWDGLNEAGLVRYDDA